MGESLNSVTEATHAKRRRLAEYLGLERNVALASAAVFLLGFGEELWKKFLPKYLERLRAGPGVYGLFGTAGVIGLVSTVVFTATVEERYAS
jgi:hypothetical protein